MKRLWSIVLIAMFLLPGCQATGDPLQEMGTEVARADVLIDHGLITAEEYIDLTEGAFSEKAEGLDRQIAYLDGESYTIRRLASMEEDEVDALWETTKQTATEVMGIDLETLSTLEVSNLLEYPDLSLYFLYSRYTVYVRGETMVFYCRYTFSQEDEDWKIISVSRGNDYVDTPRDPRLVRRFTYLDDQPIEYVQEFSIRD